MRSRRDELVAAIVVTTGKPLEEVEQATKSHDVEEALKALGVQYKRIEGIKFSETYYEGVWRTKMPTTHHANRFPEFFSKVRYQRFIAVTKDHICSIKNAQIHLPVEDKKSLRIEVLWEIDAAPENAVEAPSSFPAPPLPGNPDPQPSRPAPHAYGVANRGGTPSPTPGMRREGGPLVGHAKSYAGWALQRLISGGKGSREDAIEFLKIA